MTTVTYDGVRLAREGGCARICGTLRVMRESENSGADRKEKERLEYEIMNVKRI